VDLIDQIQIEEDDGSIARDHPELREQRSLQPYLSFTASQTGTLV